MSKVVSCIFEPEPEQWGLRGDPFLWEYLKERYQTVAFPYSIQMFCEDLDGVFEELIGEFPVSGKDYYIEQFAKKHVGMSTGWLSGAFWRNTAIPLLLRRLEQVNQ